MDSTLALRLALSFVIAGSWIALSTLASERLGTKIGGLIGNLPSNILVSMIFMAITLGPDYAAAACASVPVGMAIDTLFLLTLVVALPRGIVFGLGAALCVWFLAAAAAIRIPFLAALSGDMAASLALYLAIALLAFLIAEFGLGIRAVPKKPAVFKFPVLILRAVFAGTVVSAAVAIAQIAPPSVTGIIATFPAVLSSTMVILATSQGIGFACATGKVLILSSSNIIVYSTMVGLLFPLVGPWWGSLAAFLASVLFVSLFLPLLRRLR